MTYLAETVYSSALLQSVKMSWDPNIRKLIYFDRAHASGEGEDEVELRLNQIEKPVIIRIQALLDGLDRESLAAACRWLIRAKICKKRSATMEMSLAFETSRDLIAQQMNHVQIRGWKYEALK